MNLNLTFFHLFSTSNSRKIILSPFWVGFLIITCLSSCNNLQTPYELYTQNVSELRMYCDDGDFFQSKETLIIPLDGCKCGVSMLSRINANYENNNFNYVYVSGKSSDYYAYLSDRSECYAVDTEHILYQLKVVKHMPVLINHFEKSLKELSPDELDSMIK